MSRHRARLVLGALLMLAACQSAPPPRAQPAPSMQPDELVDLTVYFRSGTGPQAHLKPVVREVAVAHDLHRRAVELLLAGPSRQDEASLTAPLPPTTRLHSVRLDGRVAVVDLSSAVITDAARVGASARNELLALAALANTLTEFPAVDRVRVLVDGQADGAVAGANVDAFWGEWGLPDVLVRDESVIGEPTSDQVTPEPVQFSSEPQTVGDASAPPVRLGVVAAAARITTLRVTVDVAAADGGPVPAALPVARAWADDDLVVLEIAGVTGTAPDAAPPGRVELSDPAFDAVEVRTGGLPGSARVLVDASEPSRFRLHTTTGPTTRLVLDVAK